MDQTFFDPVLTADGKLYAPQRFNEIVKEKYEISKRIHTSYNELGEITPKERTLLLQFINEDIQHDNSVKEQIIKEQNNKFRKK